MNEVSLVAPLVGLAPGAVGGVCSVFVGHPIDLIKVRMQVGHGVHSGANVAVATSAMASNSTFGMLRGIFLAEGVPGLYRGVAAPLIAVTPAFAVSFWAYDMTKRGIRDYKHLSRDDPLSLGQITLAGAFSGIPLALIIGPTERIKCLMQVDKSKYSGFSDCLQQVYKEGGVRSVFRGTASTALRDVPGCATYFLSYEGLKRALCRLEDKEQATIRETFIAGGFAGIANWIVALPFDTVKSRWQTAPVGKYKSVVDVFLTLLRDEGASALFRGLSPALLRAFPASAACICGVETMKGLLEGSS